MSLINKFTKLQSTNLTDILDEIGGNITVEKVDIYNLKDHTNDFGESTQNPVVIPGYCGVKVQETGDIISIMSSKYGIVQYKNAVQFLQDMMQSGDITIPYGAVTNKGARLHLMCKTNHTLNVGGGDEVQCYFTVSSSHDGTRSLVISCTPIHTGVDVVFTPMGKGLTKLKHSSHVETRINTISKTMQRIVDYFQEFVEVLQESMKTKMTPQNCEDFTYMLLKGESTRAQNIRNKIIDIYMVGEVSKIPSCRGNLFGLLMAGHVYADLYKTVRKSKARNEIDAKLESRLTGDGARLKADLFINAKKWIK